MVSAAPVEVAGKVETQFEYKKDESGEYGFTGKTGIRLEPSLTAGNNVRLGIELETLPDQFDEDEDDNEVPNRDFADPHGSMSNVLSRVWLETEGPFWNGGPEVTATVGDKKLEWNGWIGHLGYRRGITVEGIDLGVAEADAFYVWETAGEDGRPIGVRVSTGIIEGIDLSAMAVRRADNLDAAISAGTEVDGIRIDGTLALDNERQHAFRVDASMTPTADLTLKAGYRQMEDGFAPMYPERDEDTGFIVPFDPDSDASGFSIGVETVQQGVTLSAEYDQPNDKAVLSAAKTFDVEGHAIDGKYTATLEQGEDVKHEVEASTTTDMIPYLQGLGLNGKVIAQGGDVEYEVGTTYQAPNGVSLEAKYHSADGAVVTGGLQVSF